MSASPVRQQITGDILEETGYTSSEEDDNSRSGANQYQSIKHIRAPPNPRLAAGGGGGGGGGGGVRSSQDKNDSKLIPAMHFTGGLELSDSSDVYCTGNNSSLSETNMVPARYNLNTAAKRSLEDRVRDYTGQTLRQDERLEHPAGSSSGRSSDSRSPFLDGGSSRSKRGGAGREIMLSDQYETPHIPQTLRGDTIWETKLDQGNNRTK